MTRTMIIRVFVITLTLVITSFLANFVLRILLPDLEGMEDEQPEVTAAVFLSELPVPLTSRRLEITPAPIASPFRSQRQPPEVTPETPPLLKFLEQILPAAPAFIQTSAQKDWIQDAGSPQRSGYIAIEPRQPWELLWTWNGADSQGKPTAHFYNAPPEARTITGGNFIYAPAGEQGLFALNKLTGQQAWQFSEAEIIASPAYDPLTGFLFAGATDGFIYMINPASGEILKTYNTGQALEKAILLAGTYIYAVTSAGELHKIHIPDLSSAWVYKAQAAAATPPALSLAHGVVVFADARLTIHAVNIADGTSRWQVNPSPLPARAPYTFSGYWPVIAEKTGLVFLRLNLGMDGLWSGPGPGQKYPTSNQETRAYLIKNPHLKNLFALDLSDGSERFIPAVGYGGVETLLNGDRPELATGPVPIVRTLTDGQEIAYIFFRSGQVPHQDGRWDSAVGEMVLSDKSLPGMQAGDLRFIQWSNSYTHITDEQCPLTMAGDTLFHSHWGAVESTRIVDRSEGLGLSYDNPIRTESGPVVIRRLQHCQDFNSQTRWATCDMTLFDDGRFWNGPGWWTYWDALDPPTPSRRAYSEGNLSRYTYVAGDLVIVQGNGGELMVFRHSGR